MKRVYLDCDEAYPVYLLTETSMYGSKSIEINDELYDRYQRVNKEFWEMNELLDKMWLEGNR